MPDFTFRDYWFCLDQPVLGGPNDPDQTPRGRTPCGWHQWNDDGEPNIIDGVAFCPICGGPASSEQWAE